MIHLTKQILFGLGLELLGGDEPPGSVCSEFTDLSIYHPIPLKQHHYNPHTLDNTAAFRSIGHKHSDTVLKP